MIPCGEELAETLIRLAVLEDIGDGDHTSLACIPSNAFGKAHLLVKQDGILAGVQVAKKNSTGRFIRFGNGSFYEGW